MADLDPYTQALFQIESGGNPNATTGSNRGLGQFGPREEATYGINDANRTDPAVQAAAVAAERQGNHAALSKALRRDPTDADHYLAHQQGRAGAVALLSNPDQPAWVTLRPFYKSDAMAQKAVMGNIPNSNPLKQMDVNQITGAGFTQMWGDRFNRALGASPTVQTAAAGSSVPMPASGGSPSGGLTQSSPLGGNLMAMLGGPGGAKPDAGAGKGLEALASQLIAAAGQQHAAPAMKLAPDNTGPMRPLPLNLPKFGMGPTGA